MHITPCFLTSLRLCVLHYALVELRKVLIYAESGRHPHFTSSKEDNPSTPQRKNPDQLLAKMHGTRKIIKHRIVHGTHLRMPSPCHNPRSFNPKGFHQAHTSPASRSSRYGRRTVSTAYTVGTASGWHPFDPQISHLPLTSRLYQRCNRGRHFRGKIARLEATGPAQVSRCRSLRREVDSPIL